MESSKQTEDSIRDWLASHLDFIEPNLTLVGKEYYLPDNIGSKGFIDILCKDLFNNFVIIEVKRATSSARQAMNEILKYHSLLRHNYRARESEIRIVIVSTHWNELVRAYTEEIQKTNIDIKGYKIELNTVTNLPEKITIVEPLSTQKGERRFAYNQCFNLFYTHKKRKSFYSFFQSQVAKAGISDYVMVELDAPMTNANIEFPYAIVTAFQKQTTNEWITAIANLQALDKVDMQENEFEAEEYYLSYLENVFIAELQKYEINDSAEVGFPEKLYGVLTIQGWTVNRIERFGVFKTDPRYTNELLLKELKGLDGSNRNKFTAIAQSSQKEQLLEIQRQSIRSLSSSPQWQKYINLLFRGMLNKKEDFKMLVDIYNPDSIITALFFAMMKGDPNYFPTYTIVITYTASQQVELHLGEILWNAQKPTGDLFNDTGENDIAGEIFRISLEPDNELDSQNLALVYTNKKVILDKYDKELENSYVGINKENIAFQDETNYYTIREYILSNKNLLEVMLKNYSTYAMFT